MVSNVGTDNRRNNFNLIRIYLSLSVVFFHCYELSGEPDLNVLNRFFNGERAVEAFFILSGYLIMKSYLRSSSLKLFFTKRIRRIYPAYFLAIFLAATLGILVSQYEFIDYFTSADLHKYLGANLLFLNFLQPTLPGVFEGNIFKIVNGSLWTLKIEVGYYILLPLIVYLRKKIPVNVLYTSIFILSCSYFMTMKWMHQNSGNDVYLFLSRQIPGQFFYFIAGAFIVELEKRDWFRPFLKWAFVPCLAALFWTFPSPLQCLFLVPVIFFFAVIIPEIQYPGKNQDISYGMYIFHFPVIQVLVHFHIYRFSPWAAVAISLGITLLLALLSWVFIERPFLGSRETISFDLKQKPALINQR